MRVALLCDETWETALRLETLLRDRGHEPLLNPSWDRLRGVDLGLVRGGYWEPHLRSLMTKALYLDADSVPFFNALTTLLRADDKAVSTEILREAGIRVPSTWLAGPAESLPPHRRPLIVKPVQGGKQAGVEVFRDHLSAVAYLRRCTSLQIVQTLIEGRYWRVIATDERVVRVYTMPSDERGVTALPKGQARDVVTDYPSALDHVAPASVRALSGAMMGVDLIEDHDGACWVLEANVGFGFNLGDEDVEQAILDECERAHASEHPPARLRAAR